MKRKLISLAFTLMMVFVMMPAFSLTANAAVPQKLWIEADPENGIPMDINVYKNTNYSNEYQIFLPAGVDASQLRLKWEDNVQATVSNRNYPSGQCPIPLPSNTNTTRYRFGSDQNSTVNVRTFQGSPDVHTIFIDIDESQGTIAALDNYRDESHTATCTGDIYIDGIKYALPQIKGRGNYTWTMSRDKFAYNIKLDTKINFPGVNSEKTKKWSMLAEVGDHSLLCNRSGFYLAEQMGIGQSTTSADVWMNGIYRGCFTITPKTDSFVTDDGYMIENDNYKDSESIQFALDGMHGSNNTTGNNNKDNLITVKEVGDNLFVDPDNPTDAEVNELKTWLQDAWDAIKDDSGYNSKGKRYTDYIDIESFAKMYLMHEYVKSYDVCAGSILFHRDGKTDADKLIAGPIWDLDNALGSVQKNGYLDLNGNNAGDRRSGKGAFVTEINEYKTSIFKTLYTKHEDFRDEVKHQYNRYRYAFDNLYIDVDAMAGNIEQSAMMNHNKVQNIGNYNLHYYSSETKLEEWDSEYKQVMKGTTSPRTDWANYRDNLKTYIQARSKWFRNTYKNDSYTPVSGVTLDKTNETATCGDTINLIATVTPNNATEPDIEWRSSDTKVATVDSNGVVTVTGYGEARITAQSGSASATCVINCNSHVIVKVKSKDPTCTKKGNVLHWKCDVCGTLFSDEQGQNVVKKKDVEIAALGHSLEENTEKAATCTEDGNTHHWSCSRCGKHFSDSTGETEIEDNSWLFPALGHDWGEAAYTWAEDNSSVTATHVCRRDDEHIETETVNVTSEVTKPATCEDKGETTYTSAAFDNEAFAVQTKTDDDIAALGHDWGEAVYTWSEDNSSVTASRVCRHDDKHVETETVNVTSEVTKPATCEDKGETTYTSAAFDNEAFAVQTKTVDDIAALGHDWGEAVYTWSEDNSSVTATHVCRHNDRHVETETVNVTSEVTKPATCEDKGETTYTSAAFGNEAFEIQTKTVDDIAALGHDWGEAVYTWSEDNSSVTASRVCRHNDEHVETETVNVTSEVTKPATCEDKGETTYTSEAFGNEAFEVQTKTVDDIAALGHNWGEAVYAWAEDNSSVTASRVCRHNDEHVETETVNVTSEVTKAATCEDKGETTYTSEAFGNEAFEVQAKTVDDVAALGHDWDEGEVTTAATCSAEGVRTYTCKHDSSHTKTEAIPIDKDAHDWDEGEVTTAATCSAEGVRTYTCRHDSSHTKTEAIPIDKDAHDWDEGEVTTAATCSAEGVRTYTCRHDSSHTKTEAIPIDENAHDWGEWTQTKPPTCAEKGSEQRVCKHDPNHVETHEIAALGHDLKIHEAKAATCTEVGWGEYQTCSRCDYTTYEEIPALGHKSGAAVEENRIEPSCTESGSYDSVVYCSDCDAELSREKKTIDALGHDYEDVSGSAVEATCTKEGKKADQKCTRCKDTIEGGVIQAKGHTPVTDAVVAATCTEKGKTEGSHCSVCNEVLTAQKEIPALGHKWDAGKVTKEPTEKEEGVKTYTCTVCNATRTEPIDKLEPSPGDEPSEAEKEIAEAKETLDNAVTDAEKIDQGSYTEESFNKLQEAIRKAKTLAADKNATAAQLKAAADDVEKAMKALEAKSDEPVDPKPEPQPTPKPEPTPDPKPEPQPTPQPSPAPSPGSDPDQKGKDGTAVGPGASAASAEKAITTMKSDADPAGSSYSILRLRSPIQTEKSIKIKWTKNRKAAKYVIYGNKCGKATKPKKLLTIKQGTYAKTFYKVAGKKVRKGTYYKFIVVALDKDNNVISTSKIIHVATKGGTVGNHKDVIVSKSAISKAKKLTVGKSVKLKAKARPQASWRKVNIHRGLKYVSTNRKVATVTKKGVIKAKGKGKCYVYAYAQNGVYKRIRVIVK